MVGQISRNQITWVNCLFSLDLALYKKYTQLFRYFAPFYKPSISTSEPWYNNYRAQFISYNVAAWDIWYCFLRPTRIISTKQNFLLFTHIKLVWQLYHVYQFITQYQSANVADCCWIAILSPFFHSWNISEYNCAVDMSPILSQCALLPFPQ